MSKSVIETLPEFQFDSCKLIRADLLIKLIDAIKDEDGYVSFSFDELTKKIVVQ